MSEPVTIERLERALALCAYLVTRDGPVMVPLFERLERELAAMRQTQDTVSRAARLLETWARRCSASCSTRLRPDGEKKRYYGANAASRPLGGPASALR
jgi:hypothetical protein